MANEATIQTSLTIRRGHQTYQSQPQSFQADVSSTKGFAPGGVTATPNGTLIDLSHLTTPGLCWVQNLDAENFVTLGTWDGTEFRPLWEYKPGEFYPGRVSRYLGVSFQGTGTDTDADVVQLMLKSGHDTDSCECNVHVFED